MRMRVCLFLFATLALAAAAGVATTGATGKPGITPLPCAEQPWEYGPPEFEALPGARAVFGRYDGGLYRIEIPAAWNGELVLFAHGYVSSAGTNGLRLRVGVPAIREHLVRNGFAWAASSYRCNGYVPGIGLQDTMALTDLFSRANNGAAPRRVYLTGVSMGGHITILGLHEFPKAFAGGFATCAAGPELFDFYTAVGAAAEVITGVEVHPDTARDDLAKMNEVLGKPPEYTDKGRQLASVQIQISGGPRPFAIEGLASRFSQNISSGAVPGGNPTPANRAIATTQIKYAIDEALGISAETINARARRKAADPEIRSAKGPYEELVPFDGRIARPLITLHGTGDLFVPIFLEQTLKRAVTAAGTSNLLVQRIIRVGGHCGFSEPEQTRAFDDLVRWVRDGVRPKGDQILGDLSNAGLTFTQPLRPGDPGGVRVLPARTAQP
jgi:pimeloyl-ACP methyl ester carboxylesterase